VTDLLATRSGVIPEHWPRRRNDLATTIPGVSDQSDAKKIAAQKADELVALSWEDLVRYEPRVEEVTSVNGRRFRVKSHSSWDMDAWESDMRVTVKVYATRGWRRYWPVTGSAFRHGEDLPARRPA
jgi:hypothetical protein